MLNPALVLIEVPLNAYVLWVNRDALASGVAPRAADRRRAGAGRDRRHAASSSSVSPDWLKLCTFVVLLPLILLQAAGFRRPIRCRALGRPASSAPASACSIR